MSANLHFELPKELILNANDRMHWAEKARITKNLRAMGAIAARQVEPMERAHLTIRVGYSDNRRRDDHNLMPTYKALIDGITEHLLPDDDREHLTGPDLRSRVAGKTGILVLDFELVALVKPPVHSVSEAVQPVDNACEVAIRLSSNLETIRAAPEDADTSDQGLTHSPDATGKGLA
jgi:hypothetical protein